MTPFASVAMLEKLALSKIAFCRAPALSSVSSASLRAVLLLAPLETPICVLVASFLLVMVLPQVSNHHLRYFADKHIIFDDQYHGRRLPRPQRKIHL